MVEFGVLDRYVAAYYPLPGDTVDNVLRALAALLDANGLPAMYDPGQGELTLDEELGESDTFFWSITDMGLDPFLEVSYESIGTTVQFTPTLSQWGLSALAFALTVAVGNKFGRRRAELEH